VADNSPRTDVPYRTARCKAADSSSSQVSCVAAALNWDCNRQRHMDKQRQSELAVKLRFVVLSVAALETAPKGTMGVGILPLFRNLLLRLKK
jgi:hypothetical protein